MMMNLKSLKIYLNNACISTQPMFSFHTFFPPPTKKQDILDPHTPLKNHSLIIDQLKRNKKATTTARFELTTPKG